ncbi:nudC domain-containing protein 1 isoform X2 [Phymastichus coffea]|uniref:nudC domain-containing protein 1 isoform X2 n=1 Tax=Phymastichus coffea TaxID=108790 RepID=UPI00273AC4AA|nr:nudC domain-containing protein 1 isoform X2 [Phymastichus coffea]
MAITVDLCVDKKLLNHDFEKYQFCSEKVPIKYEKKLEAEILQLEPNANQASLLEARLFAFHNNLFKNPFDSTCWFIDNNGSIWRYDASDGSLDKIYTSKKIHSNALVYNSSISFASKNIAVINDGNGALTFLKLENDKSVNILLIDEIDETVILDARLIELTSKIIVALYKVEKNQGKTFSRLIFLFYNYKTNFEDKSITLKLVQKQTAKVSKVVENLYIEKTGTFFYITSQNEIKFDFDSVNPIKNNDNTTIDNREIKIPRYCWSQDKDSITVYIKIPKKYDNVKAKVETTHTSISILVGDLTLLDGQTTHRLESDLTIWKQNDDTLEVELSKYESGLMWNELIVGNDEGEYLPNQELAAEIHARLSHLCSDQLVTNIQGQPTIGFNSEQLEDCDVSTQAVCIRYNHDGCLWIIEESKDGDWDVKHVNTFPAFGYVEASKTNKKFCISSPDGSFIAIIEHTRNVFLYERPERGAKIAKQIIVEIGNDESSIIGAAFVDKCLIILTKNTLYQLQVYS